MKIAMFTDYSAGGTTAIVRPVVKALSEPYLEGLYEKDHEVTLEAVGTGEQPSAWTYERFKEYDVLHFWNFRAMLWAQKICWPQPLPRPSVLTVHHIPLCAMGAYHAALDTEPDVVHSPDPYTLRQMGQMGFTGGWHIPQYLDGKSCRPLAYPKKFTVGAFGGDTAQKRLKWIEGVCRDEEVPCRIHESSKRWAKDEEILELFSNISCYVVASFDDAGPVPALEALMHGRPVITTRVGQLDYWYPRCADQKLTDVYFYDGSKRGLCQALNALQERFAFNFFRPQTVALNLPWTLDTFEDWHHLRREYEALYRAAKERFDGR